jgi:hypothetical protein
MIVDGEARRACEEADTSNGQKIRRLAPESQKYVVLPYSLGESALMQKL